MCCLVFSEFFDGFYDSEFFPPCAEEIRVDVVDSKSAPREQVRHEMLPCLERFLCSLAIAGMKTEPNSMRAED